MLLISKRSWTGDVSTDLTGVRRSGRSVTGVIRKNGRSYIAFSLSRTDWNFVKEIPSAEQRTQRLRVAIRQFSPMRNTRDCLVNVSTTQCCGSMRSC